MHPQKGPQKLGGANPILPDQLIPREELFPRLLAGWHKADVPRAKFKRLVTLCI